MSSQKVIGIFLIIIASFGLYLESNNTFIPMVETIAQPGTTGIKFSEWIVALVVYLFVISSLDDKSAVYLTLVLVLGGIFFDSKKNGKSSLFTTLFS